MKTTVKTIAIASIIALGTASAFAKPGNGHHNNPQGKTVTTTTVKTTTTKTVKVEPKKVASNHHARPEAKHVSKKESGHIKNHGKHHVAKHEIHPSNTHRPCQKPVAVVKTSKRPVPAPVVVVKEVEVRPVHAEVDGASLAAGAIIGGIIGLTIAAAAN